MQIICGSKRRKEGKIFFITVAQCPPLADRHSTLTDSLSASHHMDSGQGGSDPRPPGLHLTNQDNYAISIMRASCTKWCHALTDIGVAESRLSAAEAARGEKPQSSGKQLPWVRGGRGQMEGEEDNSVREREYVAEGGGRQGSTPGPQQQVRASMKLTPVTFTWMKLNNRILLGLR